jgi:valyl-tRNA synthetase
VHRAAWPERSELGDLGGDPAVLDAVAGALRGIRGAKSQARVSMKAELSAAGFVGTQAALDAVALAEEDLRRAGRIRAKPTYVAEDIPELSVTATLADDV